MTSHILTQQGSHGHEVHMLGKKPISLKEKASQVQDMLPGAGITLRLSE